MTLIPESSLPTLADSSGMQVTHKISCYFNCDTTDDWPIGDVAPYYLLPNNGHNPTWTYFVNYVR